MIYYHFNSKAALYREILRDMFHAVGERVRAVAASDATPRGQARRSSSRRSPTRPRRGRTFPPIWFREIAEGGAHLDAGTLADVAGIVQTLGGDPRRKASAAGGFRRSIRCSCTAASSGRC